MSETPKRLMARDHRRVIEDIEETWIKRSEQEKNESPCEEASPEFKQCWSVIKAARELSDALIAYERTH